MSTDQPSPPQLSSPDHLPAATPEVRLLLICHGEGLQNRYADLQQNGRSQADGGLTAFGWEQTNLLAQWLITHETIDALFAAPVLRSRLTAQRLGQSLNLPVTVHDGLPGRFVPGTTLPGAWDPSQRTIAHAVAGATDTMTAYDAYDQQLSEALDSIIQGNWGRTIAVVLSGNGVATAIRHFAGSQCLAVAVCHTGITELRRQEGAWYLMYVNRREHLPAPALPPERARLSSARQPQGDDHSLDLTAVTHVYNNISVAAVSVKNPGREERLRHCLRFAQLKPDLAVVDVGTGSGLMPLLLAEEGACEVIGIDISPVMLEGAEYMRLRNPQPSSRRVNYRLAPAHAIPFRDERFDAAVCRLLLHHSHYPQDILVEIVRLLKHGGTLLLADLLSDDDPVKRATQNAIEERRNPSHVTARSTEQYRKLVAGAGLVIEAEQVAVFERELGDWLDDFQTDQTSRNIAREMLEAGLETDAAGLNVRRRGNKLYFDQRLFYLKARKP